MPGGASSPNRAGGLSGSSRGRAFFLGARTLSVRAGPAGSFVLSAPRVVQVVVLMLLLALVLAQAADVLPAPTGPSPVGTRILFLTDRSRPAPSGEGSGRPLMAQLWYPAVASSGTGPARYVPDPSLVDLLVDEGYYGQPAERIGSWREIDTHARADADFAGGAPFPLVLLSHGLGISRMNYTALAVELASHGFAVATLDHPRGGVVVLGDGAVLTTSDDPELEARWEERALEWVADFRFAIDELARRFPGQVAVERVAVIGHSMGGAAALAAGGRDERIVACADLDGAPLALTEKNGLARPSLFVKSDPLYSDEE